MRCSFALLMWKRFIESTFYQTNGIMFKPYPPTAPPAAEARAASPAVAGGIPLAVSFAASARTQHPLLGLASHQTLVEGAESPTSASCRRLLTVIPNTASLSVKLLLQPRDSLRVSFNRRGLALKRGRSRRVAIRTLSSV